MTPQTTDSAVEAAARTILKRKDSASSGLRSGALSRWPTNYNNCLYHRSERPGGGNTIRALFETEVMKMMMSGAKMKRKTSPT